MDKDIDDILKRVAEKSPVERDTFRKDFLRGLEEIPMRMLLRDPGREMSPANWLALRSWILGVTGAGRPAFVVDDTPRPGHLERLRLATRDLLEAASPWRDPP